MRLSAPTQGLGPLGEGAEAVVDDDFAVLGGGLEDGLVAVDPHCRAVVHSTEVEHPRLASLELRMWQAYYAKENVRLFGLLLSTLREQYHYSWAVAAREGFHLARAAATFGNARDHYDAVLPDLVRDAETGYLFEAGDAGELSRQLQRLCDQPETARRMGTAARRRAEDEYDVEVFYRRLTTAYEAARAARVAARVPAS